MERLFRSLKSDRVPSTDYLMAREAQRDISHYLMHRYNWIRPHQFNDGLPPAVAEVKQVLDQPGTFTLWQDGRPARYVHGIVSHFTQGSSGFRRTRYELLLEPQLARLELCCNWRIFQEKSVPEILQALLKEHRDSGNYDLSYQGNNLTITKALLNVIADAKTKVYGDADPSLTYQVSGLKNGDTAGAVLNGGSLSRVAGENVGVYGIK